MSTTSDDNRKTFANFDRPFQEKIMQAMLTDRQWASQIAEVLDTNFFEYAYLRQLADKYLGYYNEYKEFPSLELFTTVVKESFRNSNDAVLVEQIVNVIKNTKLKKDLGDLAYVKNATMSFCRQQSFKKALIDCTQLVDNPEQYDQGVEIIKRAISAGQTQTPGLSLEDDIDARYSETYRSTIKTNIQSANGEVSIDDRKILNGGSGRGELNVVIAPTGVGKSHFLVHIGAQALVQGKNVLHFTFELNERVTGVRYDSHLLGIDSLDCPDNKDSIKEFYKANAGTLGKLRIKYFPTGSATVNTLRNFIDKLALENFRPDLLVIDYAQIMRSSEKYDLPRMELKKIFEELRAFAGEIDVPIWTACQSNKEGAESDIISLANMSEAYAQAHICDFVVGLGRPESQKASGIGTLFIAKNRAGVDGVQFKLRIDTAQSRFTLLTEEEVKTFTIEEQKKHEDDMNLVRRSYRELNAKKLMGKDTNLQLEKVNG